MLPWTIDVTQLLAQTSTDLKTDEASAVVTGPANMMGIDWGDKLLTQVLLEATSGI
jgi:hypothetical protein